MLDPGRLRARPVLVFGLAASLVPAACSSSDHRFAQVARIGGRADQAPAIAALDGRMHVAWRGAMKDGVWAMDFDGAEWSAQEHVSTAETSAQPGLAVYRGKLYAAWKGADEDESLWYATLDAPPDGWSPQHNVPGVGSKQGPALAVFRDRLYLVWRGMDADPGLWWASFDGATWSGQALIAGAASSAAPALAATRDRLVLAWKGLGGDLGVWWATYDGRAWSVPARLSGPRTTVGPSLAASGAAIVLAYRGAAPDPATTWIPAYDVGGKLATSIEWMRLDRPSDPVRLRGGETLTTPAVAVSGGDIVFAWTGARERSVYLESVPLP